MRPVESRAAQATEWVSDLGREVMRFVAVERRVVSVDSVDSVGGGGGGGVSGDILFCRDVWLVGLVSEEWEGLGWVLVAVERRRERSMVGWDGRLRVWVSLPRELRPVVRMHRGRTSCSRWDVGGGQ